MLYKFPSFFHRFKDHIFYCIFWQKFQKEDRCFLIIAIVPTLDQFYRVLRNIYRIRNKIHFYTDHIFKCLHICDNFLICIASIFPQYSSIPSYILSMIPHSNSLSKAKYICSIYFTLKNSDPYTFGIFPVCNRDIDLHNPSCFFSQISFQQFRFD